MNTKKILLIGCGGVVVVGFLLVLLVVLFVAHAAKSPAGMRISVNAPVTVSRGKELELVVTVINERKSKPLTVGSIDIGEDYIKGFSVISSEPPYASSTRSGILENRSFDFNRSIPANSTNTFTFKLLARKVGKYSADLDVYEGMQVLTMVIETQVE